MASPSALQAQVPGQGKAVRGSGQGGGGAVDNVRDPESLKLLAPSSCPSYTVPPTRDVPPPHPDTKEG